MSLKLTSLYLVAFLTTQKMNDLLVEFLKILYAFEKINKYDMMLINKDDKILKYELPGPSSDVRYDSQMPIWRIHACMICGHYWLVL